MAKYIDADTVVGLRFFDDTCGIEKTTIEVDTIGNILDNFTEEGCPEPADVVSVSAYKQVMWERDVAVEQLKQIRKDVREVTDDVVHLQRLLSADIVKIVRCKNCKYRSYDEVFCCYWCEHEGMAREVKHDFYCGYGEE